ncbi:MAG TPA: hypothetical protein V6D08_00710 [Candidatus Obscuribacterales bacterium]
MYSKTPYHGHFRVPHDHFYHRGFYFSGTFHDRGFYFAHRSYCPTEWFFEIRIGRWYSPSYGYVVQPPAYYGPITVVAVETEYEQVFDSWSGTWVWVEEETTWYYNAYWYPEYGSYGYFDYRGNFHWLQ